MIRSQPSNNNYREGWDQIFGQKAPSLSIMERYLGKSDWTAGKTVSEILAIRYSAKANSKSPEEVIESGIWKPN